MRDNDENLGEHVEDAVDAVAKAKAAKEESTAKIVKETCTGDVRDFLLDRVKQLGKPWAAMSEDEQADQIHGAKRAADYLVARVIEIVAADGKRVMKGKLVKAQVKDKINVQVDFSREDEQRHELMDSVGMIVLLVVADAGAYTGEQGPAEPTPDQSNLIEAAEKLKKGDKKVTSIRKK